MLPKKCYQRPKSYRRNRRSPVTNPTCYQHRFIQKINIGNIFQVGPIQTTKLSKMSFSTFSPDDEYLDEQLIESFLFETIDDFIEKPLLKKKRSGDKLNDGIFKLID